MFNGFTSTSSESERLNCFQDESSNLFSGDEILGMRKNCLQNFKNILHKVEPDQIIAKDLPRLNISIENLKINEDITNRSAQVLFNLTKFLDTKKELEAKEFQNLFKEHKSDHKDLFKFLIDYYGENSKELLILRCITQKALAQPIIYFKKLLSTVNIPFRDKKWNIEIKREPNDELISVTHIRREKVESNIPEDDQSVHYKTLYTFCWKVIIFMKETENELILDSAKCEFISLDDFNHEIQSEFDMNEETLIKIFNAAFNTIKNFDLKTKSK